MYLVIEFLFEQQLPICERSGPFHRRPLPSRKLHRQTSHHIRLHLPAHAPQRPPLPPLPESAHRLGRLKRNEHDRPRPEAVLHERAGHHTGSDSLRLAHRRQLQLLAHGRAGAARVQAVRQSRVRAQFRLAGHRLQGGVLRFDGRVVGDVCAATEEKRKREQKVDLGTGQKY